MPTLADTFALFFNDTDTDYSVCVNCGKPHNNVRHLYTTDDGDQAWVCEDCAAQRDAESQTKIDRQNRSIADAVARDAWEERY